MSGEGADAETVDAFLGGRFRLLQPRRGFRCGSEALFLAATVPAEAAGVAVDLGCGPGAVGFAVAARAPSVRVVLVDVDPATVDRVARSRALAENAGLAARLLPVAGDVAEAPERWRPAVERGTADHVLMNPPFFAPGRHRPAEDPDRRRARSRADAAAGLGVWFDAARRLLAPGGRLSLVLPAEALSEILDGLARGFGGVTIHPLWPRPGVAAKRVVVTAARDSRRPLALAPGLVLHDASGTRHAAAAEAILREAAPFPGIGSG